MEKNNKRLSCKNMNKKYTIVLVLKDGKGFSFRDVELIARHINGKWKSPVRPHIICLWNKASEIYDLGNIKIIPLKNNFEGTWSRFELYSPEMEQYRPFLYLDLDTAVIGSLENLISLIPHPSMFITLEDFYQKGQLATGVMWVPAESDKVKKIWEARNEKIIQSRRMDYLIRKKVTPDGFWQQLTSTIYDFKPKEEGLLSVIPQDANLICFHGRPRIFQIAESSISIDWVKEYVNQIFLKRAEEKQPEVTVIIPYKEDRGWLKEAIDSVPAGVQLLLSQGDGNWPENFNKALPLAKGKYIRWLHEDDILAENCIENSVKILKKNNVDFIHGNAIEFQNGVERKEIIRVPRNKKPVLDDLLCRNDIHQATLMYKREVFEKLGGLDPSPKYYSFEEFEFNLRCLKEGFKIGYCDSVLAYYRRHPNQIIFNVNKKKRLEERNELVRKYKGNGKG